MWPITRHRGLPIRSVLGKGLRQCSHEQGWIGDGQPLVLDPPKTPGTRSYLPSAAQDDRKAGCCVETARRRLETEQHGEGPVDEAPGRYDRGG